MNDFLYVIYAYKDGKIIDVRLYEVHNFNWIT